MTYTYVAGNRMTTSRIANVYLIAFGARLEKTRGTNEVHQGENTSPLANGSVSLIKYTKPY